MTTAFELDAQPVADIETKNPISLPSDHPHSEILPRDYSQRFYYEEDADPEFDAPMIEAAWGGEAKVIAEFDLTGNTAGIKYIRRPGHWGEDDRAFPVQEEEYRLAVEGFILTAANRGAEMVETDKQKGPIAGALLNAKVPSGWERRIRVDYLSKEDSGKIDVGEAVKEGAGISVQFEKKPAAEVGIGQLAARGGLVEVDELARAA